MDNIEKLINEVYLEVLGRFADDCGLHTYSRLFVLKKMNKNQLRTILLESDEYRSKQNSEKDRPFVELVEKIPLYKASFSNDNTKSIVFVEGRKLDYVKNILCYAHKHLQPDWALLFITTYEALEYYIEQLAIFQNVKFKVVDSLNDVQEYNDLLLSLYFWKVLLKDIKHAFIMQSDSLLIKPIDEAWLKYDYIGAASPCGTIMNGGFCIRNVKSIINCLYNKFTEENIEEDKYYTKMLRMMTQKCLPNYDTQRLFSWESVCGSQLPSGFHKLWVHQPHEFTKVKNYVLSQINKNI